MLLPDQDLRNRLRGFLRPRPHPSPCGGTGCGAYRSGCSDSRRPETSVAPPVHAALVLGECVRMQHARPRAFPVPGKMRPRAFPGGSTVTLVGADEGPS